MISSQVARTKTPRPAHFAPKVEPETPATPLPIQKYGIFAYILPYLIIIKHNEM